MPRGSVTSRGLIDNFLFGARSVILNTVCLLIPTSCQSPSPFTNQYLAATQNRLSYSVGRLYCSLATCFLTFLYHEQIILLFFLYPASPVSIAHSFVLFYNLNNHASWMSWPLPWTYTVCSPYSCSLKNYKHLPLLTYCLCSYPTTYYLGSLSCHLTELLPGHSKPKDASESSSQWSMTYWIHYTRQDLFSCWGWRDFFSLAKALSKI